jgi:hypothetical protein
MQDPEQKKFFIPDPHPWWVQLQIYRSLPNSGRGGGEGGGSPSSLSHLQVEFGVELLEIVNALLLK